VVGWSRGRTPIVSVGEVTKRRVHDTSNLSAPPCG